MASANIFQQYLQAPKSIDEYSSDMDKAQINKLALLSQQQAMKDDEAARQASIQAGGDNNKLLQLLQSSGNYKAAQGVQKSMLEADKTQADIDAAKATAEKHFKETEKLTQDIVISKQQQRLIDAQYHAQGLAYVKTPADIITYIDQGIARGVIPADQRQSMLNAANKMPSVEAFVQAARAAAVGILDQYKKDAEDTRHEKGLHSNEIIASGHDKTSSDNNKRDNDTRIKTTGMSVAATMRGQNMTDARSRETNQLTREANQNIYDPERGILVNKATGLARPASTIDGRQVGAKEKSLTEGQAKSVAFASRMENSNNIIEQLDNSGTSTSWPGSRAGYGIGAAITAVQPESNQKLDQAKRDFINAVLRRESGAVISASEFKNAEAQYFPQIGDAAGTKAQKAQNRRIALEGIKADIPSSYGNISKKIIDSSAPKTVNWGDLQ